MAIASAEGFILFVLVISNAFQNNILPNPEEIVYPSLPYIYLDWYKKIKMAKTSISLQQSEIIMHASNQVN